ncbi:MAG: DUF1573 domain-containing protein [Gemmataceae bacterium]
MYRHVLVLGIGLCWACTAGAASWADSMFDHLTKDFGSVPRGPTLSHPFRLTNNTGQPVHIGGVRSSCGCVSPTVYKHFLAPGESTVILAAMDTRRFSGVKSVTIYVQIEQPKTEEVRLWVRANSRDDVSVMPDSLAFGTIRRTTSPTVEVTVTLLGSGHWKVENMQCDSNYVKLDIEELHRRDTDVAYRLRATLRPDAPVGKWYSDVWLKTNNPATPTIRVPLTVEIESTLTISPPVVMFGKIKAGGSAERRVILRGIRPFRITEINGADEAIEIQENGPGHKPVHVLTFALRPLKSGLIHRTFRIFTDLKDENHIDIQAKAEIEP